MQQESWCPGTGSGMCQRAAKKPCPGGAVVRRVLPGAGRPLPGKRVVGHPARPSCATILRGHAWRHGLRAGLLGLALGAAVLAQAQALPEGGEVVRGEASMSRSGQRMTLHQRSDKAGINWQSDHIGEGKSVTYRQPSSSMALVSDGHRSL